MVQFLRTSGSIGLEYSFNQYDGLWGVYNNNPVPVKEKAFIDELNSKFTKIADSLYNYIINNESENW